MRATITTRGPALGIRALCVALQYPRATYYRHRQPPGRAVVRRPLPPRALAPAEQAAVLGACSDAAGPGEAVLPPQFDVGDVGTLTPTIGQYKVCVISGIDGQFSISGAGADLIASPFTVTSGTCVVAAEYFGNPPIAVTVTPASVAWGAADYWLEGALGSVVAVAPFTYNVGSGTGNGVTLKFYDLEEPPEIGCSLTQGYWKTHSAYGPAGPADPTWDLLADGPDTPFFSSGKSWYQAFWTPPAGNAYYNLAHQYMAAVLNTLKGTPTTPAVDAAIASAAALFALYTPANVAAWKGKQGARPQFVALAGTLGSYNEGLIGPGHCDDGNDES